jgi:hypothetical protein
MNIIQRIRNLIWPKKNLGSILGGFQKTINALETLKVENDAQTSANVDQINRLEDDNLRLIKEYHQADKVLNNLRGLINN